MTDRRKFLRLLAASPLLAGIPAIGQALAQTTSLQGVDSLIAKAADALDIFDFRPHTGGIWRPASTEKKR
jgi:hypothetical protein